MKLIKNALLFFALITTSVLSYKDYTNYKLVQVYANSLENSFLLNKIELTNNDFDVWNSAKDLNVPFDVLLSPDAFEKYKILFQQHNMTYSVLNDNIQNEIDNEQKLVAQSKLDGKVVATYARFNNILAWMNDIENTYSSFIYQYSAGKSFQNRDLRVLVFKVGNPANSIWIDCGIHAREWISPATCVYLIDRFVKEYTNNVPEVVNILNKYEIHILPVLNPDGYEYTHQGERFWRKNRRTNTGSTCPGVDLNRNFPFQWMTGGSSSEPCLDTYAGVQPASELETQAVINAINAKNNWSAFLSFHSYGNWFLTPYSYNTMLPSHYIVQKTAGDIFANAVKSMYGEIFTVGSSANLLYIASGASPDWSYGVKGIIHSYVIELRPRNGGGVASFDLPINQVPYVGFEIYAGVKALINYISQ